MIKTKKRINNKVSRFKYLSQKISNNVENIILNTTNTDSECTCGCSRPTNCFNSIFLIKFISSKKRWIRLLGILRDRISELSGISEMILNNGFTEYTFKSLDLYLVKSDVARQPWLANEEFRKMAEKSIYTFCLYNNVAYWQGIHDVAAALVHLQPTPNIGELTALLEKLVKLYSPILFSQSTNDVTDRANELSQKWKLLFRYFFPKASHEFDYYYDNSFSVGWFITLGFYRFGCAHISLAYTFILLVSQYDPLSSFLFRELGYIATRGYIDYLIKSNTDVDFNKCQLFSNYSFTKLIINSVINSNKIHLEPEKFINVSKNLYDTLNDKQVELSEFPLLYIFKASNMLLNSAPSITSIDPNNYFIDTTLSDIFPTSKRDDLFECQIMNTSRQYSCQINYRKKKYNRKQLNLYKKVFSFTNNKNYYKCSDYINSEIAFTYLSYLRIYSDLYRYKFRIIKPKFQQENFNNTNNMYNSNTNKNKINNNNNATNNKLNNNIVIGNVLNPKLIYNIVDFRSNYLHTGLPLEKIFGSVNTSFMTNVNPLDVLESSHLEHYFTIWLFVTDDGYDVGNDQFSTESLNNAFQTMYELSKSSITCVTLLKGGYKGLLKSINSKIPEQQSFFSRLSVKKLINWESTATLVELDPSKNLTNFATSVASAAGNIENKILQGISDIKLFNRFKQSQLPQSSKIPQLSQLSKVQQKMERLNILGKQSVTSLYTNRDHSPRTSIQYSVKLTLTNSKEITLRSNGTIKINGIILHPSKYSNAVLDIHLNVLLSISNMLSINLVDGFVDIESTYTYINNNVSNAPLFLDSNDCYTINKYRVNRIKDFKICTDMMLSQYIVVILPHVYTNKDKSENTFDKSFKSMSSSCSNTSLDNSSICFQNSSLYKYTIPISYSFVISTNSVGIIDSCKINGLLKFWRVLLIDRYHLISHLVNCCISSLKPKEVEQDSFDTSSSDNSLFINYSNINNGPQISTIYVETNTKNNNNSNNKSTTFVNRHLDLTKRSYSTELENNKQSLHKIPDNRNLKIFSRTNVARTYDIYSRTYSTREYTNINTTITHNNNHTSSTTNTINANTNISMNNINNKNYSKNSVDTINNSKNNTSLYYSNFDAKVYINTPSTTTNESEMKSTTSSISVNQKPLNKSSKSQQQSIPQQMPLSFNNVFVSRSSFNKRQNSK